MIRALPFLLFLVACGSQQDIPAAPENLLARNPDLVVQQAGILTPSVELQWGLYGPFDWEDHTEVHQAPSGSVPFVWSRDASAKLLLPAGPARDRTLSITAWAGQKATAEVSLNGIKLGTISLGSSPADYELEAPGPAWTESPDNLLQITIGAAHSLAPDRRVGPAVSRVEYDIPSSLHIDTARGELTLGPFSSVGYDLELFGPTPIVLKGTSTGPGTLVMASSRFDPATGGPLGVENTFTLTLDGERIERAFPEPPSDEGVLRVRLSWTSETDAQFKVESLRRVESSPVARPPIIFISLDTLSAKHLSFHGYSRETSPRLAEFTKDAIVFEHCVSNSTWTIPSYMSQMTGLFAYANRLEKRTQDQAKAELWEQWYLSHNRWTLAEFLRAAGYATAGFPDTLWISSHFGFPQGFDLFDPSAGAIPKQYADGGIEHNAKGAKKWLEDHVGDAPFFLFMHAFDIHGPYTPTSEYEELFAGDGLYPTDRVAPVLGKPGTMGIIHDYLFFDEELRKLKAPGLTPTAPFADAYDQGIAMTDESVGEFLDYLRSQDLFEKSLIIISSDHGETMDSADMLFAHGVIDESVLHVPLLIKLPHGAHRGKRVSTTVQLVDIYPTIVDVLGLPERKYLHGRSLLPTLDAKTPPPAPTYTEGGPMSQRAVTFEGWRLIEAIPGEESGDAFLLSWPDLSRLWKDEIVDWVQSDGPALQAYEKLLREGAEPTSLFLRIEKEGLHHALYDEVANKPTTRSTLRVLRRYFSRPRYHLYDLSVDPEAKLDVAGDHPEKVAQLQALMKTLRQKTEDARTNARPPSKPPSLSEAEIDRLEALGYAD